MTVTNANATAYSNAKKLIQLSTGRMVAAVWNTTSNVQFLWSDDGLTWTDYSADIVGWSRGSIHSYVDSGGTERLVTVWRQNGTSGGFTDNYVYAMVGTFNSGRTTITWGGGDLISNNSGHEYMDIVSCAEGTGGVIHVVASYGNASNNFATHWTAVVDSSGEITSVSSLFDIGGNHGTGVQTMPSIDIDSSKNVYAVWCTGTTGAGHGIRFRKATYSAGSWTWGTTRDIDTTRKSDGAVTGGEWAIVRFDHDNNVAMIGFHGDDGTNADVMLYQRDAADTTTTTYTLFDNASGTNRPTFGSMAVVNGDVYMIGTDASTGTWLSYVKWTRTSSTTGTVGSFVELESTNFNSGYVNALALQGDGLGYIYTSGNSSPYTVNFNLLIVPNIVISVPAMTATASMEDVTVIAEDDSNITVIVPVMTATAAAQDVTVTAIKNVSISVPVMTATASMPSGALALIPLMATGTATLVPQTTSGSGSLTLTALSSMSVVATRHAMGEFDTTQVIGLSLGSPLVITPATLAEEIEDYAQTVVPRVTATWATSKFMDDLVITATGDGTISTDVPCANEYFIPIQAGNGYKDSTFKWAVADSKDYNGSTIRCDDGFVVMEVVDEHILEYEHGWWAKSTSNGSGVYTTPQSLQFEFNDRLANYVRVTSSDTYGPILNYTVFYKDTSNTWIQIGGTHTLVGFRAEHSIGSLATIRGVRVVISSTKYANDIARIQELEPVYRSALPVDDIVSIDINKVKESYDTSVPMGALAANTCSIVLQNTELAYNTIGQTLSPYLVKDVEFDVELGWQLDGSEDVEYVHQGTYYADEWEVDADGAVTSVSCRDQSKFLMEGEQLERGYFLRNTSAGKGIEHLALRANVGRRNIRIRSVGNNFKYLFGKDQGIWEAMTAIATADVGTFYFDDSNMLNYMSRDYMYDNASTIAHSFSDSTNIISATSPYNLQANKVVVKVQPVSSENIGKQGAWRAPENTSVVVAELAGGISSSSSSVSVTNGSTPLWLDEGYFKIDDEIIKYESHSGNDFATLTRGMYGTIAASHSDGTKVREVRVFNLDFDNAPVKYVKSPFITANEFDNKIDIDRFVRTSYTASLIVSASENVEVGETVYLEGTHPTTGIVEFTAIYGVPISMPEATDKITEETQSTNNAIRRWGRKDLTIDSMFINSQGYAKRLAKFLIEKFENSAQLINMNALCVPHIQMDDVVRITNYTQMGITNKDYFVIESNISYDGGCTHSLVLKEVT